MRAAEWIHLTVFTFFTALAWIRALPATRRAKVTILGVIGLGATLISARLLPLLLPALAVSVVRDWLPAALVLLVYWQTGEFFQRSDLWLQELLARIDARIAAPLIRWLARHTVGAWIAAWFELCYLLCYAMIPLSIAALYLLRLGHHSDYFWTVVLSSTYVSYGLLPFLQTLPPRVLEEPWLVPLPPNPVRQLNLVILRNASIHANTFPSAHVAASTAAALVLARLAPWPVGVLFLTIAVGISFGTFVGRYHFASDAITGTAVAAAVYLVVSFYRM